MGRILEALQRLNELDSTSNKFKYKLHLPGYELSDENELDSKGNPINVNDDPNDEPIYKKRRAAAAYIYVITLNDPEDDSPKKYLCKIGYAKDVDIRLGQFNRDAGNPSQLDWFARIPVYLGKWDEDKQEFVPIKGKTDQLDKRIHDVIDTVTDSAEDYMKRKYQSTQAIDLRKLDVNGHRKEWYLIAPQQAVDIIEAIVNTQSSGIYGETEYNLKHPLYTATHQTKTVDDKGNVVTRTVRNKTNKYNYIHSTGVWNGWRIRVGGGGLFPKAAFYLQNTIYWVTPRKDGIRLSIDKKNNYKEIIKTFNPDIVKETQDYYSIQLSYEEFYQRFPACPKPWVEYMKEHNNRWNIEDGEIDKHMRALNDMIPEDQQEKEVD